MNNKTVLLIEDDRPNLEACKRWFEDREYEVTAVFYNRDKDNSQKIKRQFDIAIMDGLEGDCLILYDQINAKRKIIITGDFKLFDVAKSRGFETYSRTKPLREIIK